MTCCSIAYTDHVAELLMSCSLGCFINVFGASHTLATLQVGPPYIITRSDASSNRSSSRPKATSSPLSCFAIQLPYIYPHFVLAYIRQCSNRS
jgi:hypothetical protein